MYLLHHISDDVTSLLFFSAFVCVYCIHERYCPLPHSATPPSISTHTHTTYYVICSTCSMYLSQHTSHDVTYSPLFFNACVCLYYIHESYFPSQPLSTPPHYRNLCMRQWHIWKMVSGPPTQTWDRTAFQKVTWSAVFEAAKNIFRSLVKKTWRSAFDWLNIVSKSSNNRQQKTQQWNPMAFRKMTWIASLEACKAPSGQHVVCSQWHSCRTWRQFHWPTNVNDGNSILLGLSWKRRMKFNTSSFSCLH